MGGAFTAIDAEGSDGSEAGVAKALAAALLERGGAASCGCLEHAPSVNNDAKNSRNGADFMGWLSKSWTLFHGRLCSICPRHRIAVAVDVYAARSKPAASPNAL